MRRPPGFTLIELLVVIAIITIIIAGAVMLFNCAGCGTPSAPPLPNTTGRQDTPRRPGAGPATDVDADLQKFASEVVPSLQQAIDKYAETIEKYTAQRDEFAREMRRQNIDPNSRPAYVRKGEVLEEMKAAKGRLLESRKETYVRWKELKLLGDTGDTKKEMDALLTKALNEAEVASKRLESETK